MRAAALDELKDVVRRTLTGFPEIQLVYGYGSQVTGNTGPMSDVDLGVLFDPGIPYRGTLPAFSSAVARRLRGPSLDCIPLNETALELSFAVVSTGVVLYERSVADRVEYEARVMSRYYDYLPILRAQRRDILEDKNRVTRVQRYREALRRTERTIGEIRDAQR